jgi:hypothetical protein
MNPSFDPSTLPLRDIHLPGAIGWWPPAFGWWVLAAVLLGLVLAAALRLWRQRRHRAACRALEAIIASLEAGAEPARCAQEASVVLRRFAMTVDSDSPEVAGLTGERWFEYLARLGKDSKLAEGKGQLLLDTPYRSPDRVTLEEARDLCRLCVDWVRAQPARA